MSRAVPEYSPRMLKAFLRLGGDYRWFSYPKRAGREATVERYKLDIRKTSRVSQSDFDLAWDGRLKAAEPRAKIWSALKIVPADYGVRLLDNGSQEVVE